MTDYFMFKNLVTYEARRKGVKEKIYNATGIPSWRLDIRRMTISTKKAKLAIILYSKNR